MVRVRVKPDVVVVEAAPLEALVSEFIHCLELLLCVQGGQDSPVPHAQLGSLVLEKRLAVERVGASGCC